MQVNTDTLLVFLDGYSMIAESIYTLESSKILMENNGLDLNVPSDTLRFNTNTIIIPKTRKNGETGYCIGFLIIGTNIVLNGKKEIPDWEKLKENEREMLHQSYLAVQEIKVYLTIQAIKHIHKKREI